MRRTRRLVFAAPLVIVTAQAMAAAADPVDAGVAPAAPAVDAATAPPPLTAGVRPGHMLVHIRARSIQRDGFVSCHDFGPTYRGCNPPRPESIAATTMDLPLFEMDARRDATVVSIPLGERDGIQRTWSVAILAPTRTPAPAAKIIWQEQRETRIATNLTAAELRAGIELELGSRTAAPWTPLVHAPAEGAVLSVVADGRRAIVTIGAGMYDDVEPGWSVVLLDRAGKPLSRIRGTVMKVTKRVCVARVEAPARRVRRAARARLEPPPPATP